MRTFLRLLYVGSLLWATSVAAQTRPGQTIIVPNAGATGTTLNRLAIATGAPSTAVVATTASTTSLLGIVVAGAGTTGNARIAVGGQAACEFDANAVTAGNYVIASTTVGGACRDTGSAVLPVGVQIVGRAFTSGAASTVQTIYVFGPEIGTYGVAGTSAALAAQLSDEAGTGAALFASADGLVARISPTATAARTITGTAGNIAVSNGSGVVGNPVVDLVNAGTPVTACGGATQSCQVTTDAQGRVVTATPVNITGGGGGGGAVTSDYLRSVLIRTAATQVANTAAETTLSNWVMDSTPAIGRHWLTKSWGTVRRDNGASNTLSLRVRMGPTGAPTTVCQAVGVLPPTTAACTTGGCYYDFDALATYRSGAVSAANIKCNGWLRIDQVTGTLSVPISMTQQTAVDLSGSPVLRTTAQWASAGTTNDEFFAENENFQQAEPTTTTTTTATTTTTTTLAGAATDSFERAALLTGGPCAGGVCWTQIASTSLDSGTGNIFQSSDYGATPTVAPGDAVAIWNAQTFATSSNNACTQIARVPDGAGGYHGVCTGVSDANVDEVCCIFDGTTTATMLAIDNGNFQTVVQYTGQMTVAIGDRIGIERTGATTFRCLYDAAGGANTWVNLTGTPTAPSTGCAAGQSGVCTISVTGGNGITNPGGLGPISNTTTGMVTAGTQGTLEGIRMADGAAPVDTSVCNP